ncbi:uncharacterized protein LOC119688519 [Teleopsis dalmanni]|uniref:uncharacterized protein LOC119688519 n=1 Tax=Teleopsis dalmanni TaxID=139649 RepID=UPI0018CF3752|nr:uncharacterized protein LOC119688519 [Teleopsis dalmanni]
MSVGKEFTLSELASLALSSPTFDTFHISILQCLIETLFRKMSCIEDVVTVEGLRATCLEDILTTNSRVTKVRVDEFNFSPILRFENLQMKVNIMENEIKRLENELKEYELKVHMVSMATPPYIWEIYERHACAFADIFDSKDPENAPVRELLSNKTFLTAVTNIIGGPLMERLSIVKKQNKKHHTLIRNLHNQMKYCNKEAEAIESLIYEYQAAWRLLNRNIETLDKALEEMQGMLFAKCDKIHFPQIQHYFWERLKEYEDRLKKLFDELLKCPPRIRWDDLYEKCLSCGGPITPEVRYIPDDEPVPKRKPKKKEEEEINYCEGSVLPLGGDLIENIRIQEILADPDVILTATQSALFGKGYPKPHGEAGGKKVHHSALKAPHLEFRSKKGHTRRVTISPFKPKERY